MPEFEEMAQKAAALRYAESRARERISPIVRDHGLGVRAVGVLVAQERDEVADRGIADAEHLDPVASYHSS